MVWSSDAHFRQMKKAPHCWACRHYETKVDAGDNLHRCHIARQEFPYAGPKCRAYIYEPGADAPEAYQ
jgi:hypothetical protein